MAEVHHTISYVELGADDLGATRDFYARAFGWEFNDYGPTYSGIRAADGDGEVGGLNVQGSRGPGGPLVLLYSEDLDATVEGVRAAGGEVVEGPDPYPGGRRFTFRDPSGNVLGVFQSDH